MEDLEQDKVGILEEKIDKIYKSVEKTRKYFMWTLITSVIFFVLPLVGIFFLLPKIFNYYSF